jgi:hypothetical protein
MLASKSNAVPPSKELHLGKLSETVIVRSYALHNRPLFLVSHLIGNRASFLCTKAPMLRGPRQTQRAAIYARLMSTRPVTPRAGGGCPRSLARLAATWLRGTKKMPRLRGHAGAASSLVAASQSTHLGLHGPYLKIDCYGRDLRWMGKAAVGALSDPRLG